MQYGRGLHAVHHCIRRDVVNKQVDKSAAQQVSHLPCATVIRRGGKACLPSDGVVPEADQAGVGGCQQERGHAATQPRQCIRCRGQRSRHAGPNRSVGGRQNDSNAVLHLMDDIHNRTPRVPDTTLVSEARHSSTSNPMELHLAQPRTPQQQPFVDPDGQAHLPKYLSKINRIVGLLIRLNCTMNCVCVCLRVCVWCVHVHCG